MFRFDSAERADREAAAGVSLQVFDVGSGSEARFFERLHRARAIFAAHELGAFCEGFVEGAWEPTATHLHLGRWPDDGAKHKGCPVHDCSIVMSGMRVSGLSVILATPQIPLMDKQRP